MRLMEHSVWPIGHFRQLWDTQVWESEGDVLWLKWDAPLSREEILNTVSALYPYITVRAIQIGTDFCIVQLLG